MVNIKRKMIGMNVNILVVINRLNFFFRLKRKFNFMLI